MRTTSTLSVAVLLAAGALHAANLAGGLEFQVPQGWTMKSNDSAAVLFPPDMAMEPNGKDPSELYLVALYDGVRNLQDPQLAEILRGKIFPAGAQVSQAGEAQSFRAAGGTGALLRYNAISEGVALRIHIYMVEMAGGGVAGVVAMGRPALMARREPLAFTVAASLTRTASAPSARATGAAAQWEQRLRGKKLYQFSSYSSSYGSGGMSSQKTLWLGANGAYQFSRSGSVSIYAGGASGSSASQGGAQGRWRIYEQGGQVVLELKPNAGAVESIVLTSNAGKTLLNGNRWLVGD